MVCIILNGPEFALKRLNRVASLSSGECFLNSGYLALLKPCQTHHPLDTLNSLLGRFPFAPYLGTDHASDFWEGSRGLWAASSRGEDGDEDALHAPSLLDSASSCFHRLAALEDHAQGGVLRVGEPVTRQAFLLHCYRRFTLGHPEHLAKKSKGVLNYSGSNVNIPAICYRPELLQGIPAVLHCLKFA